MSALVLLSLPLSLLVVAFLAVLTIEDVALRMTLVPQPVGAAGAGSASSAQPTAELMKTAGRLVGEVLNDRTYWTCPPMPLMAMLDTPWNRPAFSRN